MNLSPLLCDIAFESVVVGRGGDAGVAGRGSGGSTNNENVYRSFRWLDVVEEEQEDNVNYNREEGDCYNSGIVIDSPWVRQYEVDSLPTADDVNNLEISCLF